MKLSGFLLGILVGITACVLGLFIQWKFNPDPKPITGYVTDAQAKAQAAIVARRSFDQGVMAGADAAVSLIQSNISAGEGMSNLYSVAYDRNPVFDPRKK